MDYLNNLNTSELLDNIVCFRQHTLINYNSIDAIKADLQSVIPNNFNAHIEIGIGTQLFRIRKMENDIFNSVSDFWSPPPNNTKDGRLNRNNEPMLYVCTDHVTPFHEARICKGEIFVLVFYRAKKPFNARLLEGVNDGDCKSLINAGLSETGFVNYRIIRDFIRTELIRDVGIGTEYLYGISNGIKELLDKANKDHAYQYTSVNNYSKKNIAIKPDKAKEYLTCDNAFVGRFIDYSDDKKCVNLYQKGMYSNLSKSDDDITLELRRGDGIIKLCM